MATLGNVVEHHFPDAVDIGCNLFAVGLAHVVGGHHLRGTLILAYLTELILYAKLSQQVLDEIGGRGQTVPVYHTLWVQVDVVGYATYIIGRLCVTVCIGHNPLTRLLEVEQSLADGMG